MCFRAGRQREGADGRLPAPGGAAQAGGGEGRVAEREEAERGVEGRGAGTGGLRAAVQGGGDDCLVERGLDRGVAPRALETRRAPDAEVSHGSGKVAHAVPHTHTPKEVVTGVQGGWQWCRVVQVG